MSDLPASVAESVEVLQGIFPNLSKDTILAAVLENDGPVDLERTSERLLQIGDETVSEDAALATKLAQEEEARYYAYLRQRNEAQIARHQREAESQEIDVEKLKEDIKQNLYKGREALTGFLSKASEVISKEASKASEVLSKEAAKASEVVAREAEKRGYNVNSLGLGAYFGQGTSASASIIDEEPDAIMVMENGKQRVPGEVEWMNEKRSGASKAGEVIWEKDNSGGTSNAGEVASIGAKSSGSKTSEVIWENDTGASKASEKAGASASPSTDSKAKPEYAHLGMYPRQTISLKKQENDSDDSEDSEEEADYTKSPFETK